MIRRSLTLSMIVGVFLVNGMLASDPKKELEFDINSITYLEDEPEPELGFDTADYLPEGFDPYSFYFNLASVPYIKVGQIDELDTRTYLPKDFNAYAYPSDVESINYIDVNDSLSLKFDTTRYLPENFDPYSKK